MSIYIIVADNINREIIAIADKRIGSASFSEDGKVKDWCFANDNAEKIAKLNDQVYITGCILEDMGNDFKSEIMTYKDLKPSEIIGRARQINREIFPPLPGRLYDPAVLFGIYDNGNPFFWFGEDDGSEITQIIDPGKYSIQMSGGMTGTIEKVATHVRALNSKKVPFQMILTSAVIYAATLDKVISPTYDLIIKPF